MEHHVYFWLKKEHQNASDRLAFETALTGLLHLPRIVNGIWGVPAAVMDRPVIDKSWDYSLSMTFESVATQDAYQENPDHHTFINTYKPFWEKVLVMDVEAKHTTKA